MLRSPEREESDFGGTVEPDGIGSAADAARDIEPCLVVGAPAVYLGEAFHTRGKVGGNARHTKLPAVRVARERNAGAILDIANPHRVMGQKKQCGITWDSLEAGQSYFATFVLDGVVAAGDWVLIQAGAQQYDSSRLNDVSAIRAGSVPTLS